MLSDREFFVFKKFANGDYVEEQDVEDVYQLLSTGMIRVGFSEAKDFASEDEKSDASKMKYVETARLTPLGRNIYQRECILRNPVRRFFYRLLNI